MLHRLAVFRSTFTKLQYSGDTLLFAQAVGEFARPDCSVDFGLVGSLGDNSRQRDIFSPQSPAVTCNLVNCFTAVL